MTFANLLKSTNCFSTCANDTFFSFNDTFGNAESKVQFMTLYAGKVSDLNGFSQYDVIFDKFKSLVKKYVSKYVKNVDTLDTLLVDRRISLPKKESSKPKSEKKKCDNPKIEKDARKSKKRSAQIAEISVIYEENESVEKLKSDEQEANLQSQIKKIFKEKQAKIMQKQLETEKSNLIPSNETVKKVKKLRLSDEIERQKLSKSLRKIRKKSSDKIKIKLKKLSLNTTTIKKEQTVSFIEEMEKLDKINGVERNLKTSFKFTPTNKTICISKIPTKNNPPTNSAKKVNSFVVSKVEVSKTPVKPNGLFAKPKNKVKELIEQFGDKFKKAASNLTKNPKKVSSVRSSIGERKAKLSSSKQEVKRRSIKHVAQFVKEIAKDINKTTGQISTNNSLVNTSTQSQKLVSLAKKTPLVVNHKMIYNQIRVNKTKVTNTSGAKTPNKSKVVPTNIIRVNKPSQSKKINPDDLKYDSNRCKQIIEMNQKKMAAERLKRLGSTSTISTISSLNSSNASLNSLKPDLQSFKTVNTTFDSSLKCVEQVKNVQKNTTFCIKQTNSFMKQTFQIKPHVINHAQKPKVEGTKTPKATKTNPIGNATIVVGNNLKTPHKRSCSADNSICRVENYGVDDIRSCDETDDEDEPSKPIPEWAKESNIMARTKAQAKSFINFTKLFKSSTNESINLDEIFKIKKNRFYHRSSSAEWRSPTVWRTNGLNGDESFRRLHA